MNETVLCNGEEAVLKKARSQKKSTPFSAMGVVVVVAWSEDTDQTSVFGGGFLHILGGREFAAHFGEKGGKRCHSFGRVPG